MLTATVPQAATESKDLATPAPTPVVYRDFRPYIKPFRVGRHAMRFLFATPEAQAWYEGGRKGGWSMDSPLRTHAAALLAFGAGGGRGDMAASC